MTVLIAPSTVVNMVLMPFHSPEKKSLIPFQTVSAVERIAVHAFAKKSFIAFHTSMATRLMFSHRSIQNCRKSSFVFHR